MRENSKELNLGKIASLGQSCPLRYLRMATRVLERMYDEILRPSGLRGSQIPVLALTALVGPTTISNLAEQLVMDRTTLTRGLKPLEREGIIEIEAGKDRRTREVSLTPKGMKVMTQVIPLWESSQNLIIQELGKKWHRELVAILSEVESIGSSDDS